MFINQHLAIAKEKLNPVMDRKHIGSGIKDLDSIINGFEKGNLYISGGQQSVGKTSMIIKMANEIHQRRNEQNSIALFSFDLSAGQLTKRFVCHLSQIPLSDITNDAITNSEREGILEEALNKLNNETIYIDDNTSSLNSLLEKIEVLHNCQCADIVFIDSLHLLSCPGEDMIPSLKKTADRLQLPIVVTVTINKTGESRPGLKDLQDKMDVRQADVVLCLWRPEYYTKERGETELLVLKNETGKTGTIKLVADLQRQTFRDELNV
jgi:replicative DNA helicase